MKWTSEILFAVFISFPENILVLLMGFALCNIKVAFNKILFISILYSIWAFIVNVLDIAYGLHTIFLLIITGLLVLLILQIKIYQGVVSVLAGFVIQSVLQLVYYQIVIYFFCEIDLKTLRTDFKAGALFIYPVFVLSIVLLKFMRKKKITLI